MIVVGGEPVVKPAGKRAVGLYATAFHAAGKRHFRFASAYFPQIVLAGGFSGFAADGYFFGHCFYFVVRVLRFASAIRLRNVRGVHIRPCRSVVAVLHGKNGGNPKRRQRRDHEKSSLWIHTGYILAPVLHFVKGDLTSRAWPGKIPGGVVLVYSEGAIAGKEPE